MEGITQGIRSDKDKKVRLQISKEKEQKEEMKEKKQEVETNPRYKIKTKYGNIPVTENKKDERKGKKHRIQVISFIEVLLIVCTSCLFIVQSNLSIKTTRSDNRKVLLVFIYK